MIALTVFDIHLEPHRAVALHQGQRVATFTFQQNRWHLQPGEFFCRFTLEPNVSEADHKELATLLYKTALPQLKREGALLLRTGVMEDDPLLSALHSLGFRTYRVRNGEFAAFANLFPADLMPENRGTELDTATFGTRRAYRHIHEPVMLAIWAHLVRYALAHDCRAIRAEIDSDYPWILEVCAHLPMTLGKDYVSLVRVLEWTVLPEHDKSNFSG